MSPSIRAVARCCASRSATRETPIERKPEWIKTKAKMGPEYTALQELVKDEGLHTVCQEAGCPNIYECWEDREATFLIGGSQCTRRCDFCQIDTGKPADYDTDEPRRVAESVTKMGLRYATVTGVARDDLPDEGAWLHAETVRAIHAANPGTGVEILATDFSGNPDLLAEVFSSRPEVFAHNVETVPRIFKRIRPAFTLRALARRADPGSRGRAHHQVEPHPRHGRGARRGQSGAAATCTTPAPTSSRSRSTCARARGICRSRAGCGPRSSSSIKDEAEEIGFLGVLAGTARALELPCRAPVGPVDAREGPRHPGDLRHLADAELGFAQAVS